MGFYKRFKEKQAIKLAEFEISNKLVNKQREERLHKQAVTVSQNLVNNMIYLRQESTGIVFAVCLSNRSYDHDIYSQYTWAFAVPIPKDMEPLVEHLIAK